MIPSQVSAHSHIKGLGLNNEGLPIEPSSSGYAGNALARQAAGRLVVLIKSNKSSGVPVFISGPAGVGKSALVYAIKQELSEQTPMAHVLGGEFGDEPGADKSTRIKRMRMALRNAVAVKMHETKRILEGEVTELTLHEAKSEEDVKQIGRNISHITITFKAGKGTRQVQFDPSIYASLVREQVQVGDIIYMEVGSGLIKRLGRCDAYRYEYDLESDTYLPLPKGEVESAKEVVQEASLLEMDFATANPEPGADLLSQVKCIVQNTGLNRINMNVRSRVDSFVSDLIAGGRAELVSGLLIIEDAHLMSYELYSFLRCALMTEKNMPMVILIGQRELLSNEHQNAKGVYEEFFKSSLNVALQPLSIEDLKCAIVTRAKHEQLALDDGSVALLTQTASENTLRYPFALISYIKSTNTEATITSKTVQQAMTFITPAPSQVSHMEQ